VAPIITGITVHFRFHIRCISIHKLLYFNFFSASFCTTFIIIIIIIINEFWGRNSYVECSCPSACYEGKWWRGGICPLLKQLKNKIDPVSTKKFYLSTI
jgi:hypothetical protein